MHIQRHVSERSPSAVGLITAMSPRQIIDCLFFDKYEVTASQGESALFQIGTFGSIVYSILVRKTRRWTRSRRSSCMRWAATTWRWSSGCSPSNPLGIMCHVLTRRFLQHCPRRCSSSSRWKIDQFRALKDAFDALLDSSVGGNERFHEKTAMHFRAIDAYEQTPALQTRNDELVEDVVRMHMAALLSDATPTFNRFEIFHVLVRIMDTRKHIVLMKKVIDTKNKARYT